MNWKPWAYTLFLACYVCIVALEAHRGQVDLVAVGHGVIIGMLLIMSTSAWYKLIKRKQSTT
jgi:hypothetical protein